MFAIKDIEFEKCGDIIVAPKHNVFALTCSLCHDIFIEFNEFRTHISKEHDVYLRFRDFESTDEEEDANELDDEDHSEGEKTKMDENQISVSTESEHKEVALEKNGTEAEETIVSTETSIKSITEDDSTGVKNSEIVIENEEQLKKTDEESSICELPQVEEMQIDEEDVRCELTKGNEEEEKNSSKKSPQNMETLPKSVHEVVLNEESSSEMNITTAVDEEPLDKPIETEMNSEESTNNSETLPESSPFETVESNFPGKDADQSKLQNSLGDKEPKTMNLNSEMCASLNEAPDVTNEKNLGSVEQKDHTGEPMQELIRKTSLNNKIILDAICNELPRQEDDVDSKEKEGNNQKDDITQLENLVENQENITNMEIDEDVPKDVAIISNSLNDKKGIGKIKNKKKVVRSESHALSGLQDTGQRKFEETEKVQKINEEIIENVGISKDSDIESQHIEEKTEQSIVPDDIVVKNIEMKELARIINPQTERLNIMGSDSPEKQTLEETERLNADKIERANEITSKDLAQEVIKESPKKRPARRKSIKVTEFFEELDLELDEEDEDMKIFESLMLREESDEEKDLEDDKPQSELQLIDEKETKTESDKDNKNSEDNCIKKDKENFSQKGSFDEKPELEVKNSGEVKETKISTFLSAADLNKKEITQPMSNLNDRYTDKMPILLDEDANEIENCSDPGNGIEKLEQMVEKEQTSKKQENESTQIVNTLGHKNKQLQTMILERSYEQDGISQQNVNCLAGKEKNNSTGSTNPMLQSNNQTPKSWQIHKTFKNEILGTPASQYKPVPIVDTPRPTQLVTRNIITKKRKINDEEEKQPYDDSNLKPSQPLTEPNRRSSRKVLKLDDTEKQKVEFEKQQPLVQKVLSSSTMLENSPIRMSEEMKNSQPLQKVSDIHVKSVSNTNRRKSITLEGVLSSGNNVSKSMTPEKVNTSQDKPEKIIIQEVQQLPSINIKNLSLSHIKQTVVGSHIRHLNPVTSRHPESIPPSAKAITLKDSTPLTPFKLYNPKSTPKKTPHKVDDDDVIGDLFEQVSKENVNVNEIVEKEPQTSGEELQVFNSESDAVLLQKVGLHVIVDPSSVLGLLLKKRESIEELAEKFSVLFCDSGLANKSPDKDPSLLKERFINLMNAVNGILPQNKSLQVQELKRLIFLITRWHGDLMANFFFHKRPIPDHLQKYVRFFNFLPKSARRFFYCEYCSMWFTNLQKMESHRSTHNFSSNNLTCTYCNKVFKRHKAFENHEEKCKFRIS